MKIESKALRQFRKMDAQMAKRLRDALICYERNKTGDVKKLQGRKGYRLRVGSYRAIFEVDKNEIIVIEVGPRGDVYYAL